MRLEEYFVHLIGWRINYCCCCYQPCCRVLGKNGKTPSALTAFPSPFSTAMLQNAHRNREMETQPMLTHADHSPSAKLCLVFSFTPLYTASVLTGSTFSPFRQKLFRNRTSRVRVWRKRPGGTPKRTCWPDPARMTATCLWHSTILWPVATTHSASLKVTERRTVDSDPKNCSEIVENCLYSIL